MTFSRSFVGNKAGTLKSVMVRFDHIEGGEHLIYISQFEGGNWKYSDKLAEIVENPRGARIGFKTLKEAKKRVREDYRTRNMGWDLFGGRPKRS